MDILTGTFGKALGAGSGGYIAARKPIVDWLRQRSRPYLFSNSIPPVVAAVSLRVLDLLDASTDLREKLFENTRYFRAGARECRLQLETGRASHHSRDARRRGACRAHGESIAGMGVYVVGFSFPVVPKGQARIRTQMSAALTRPQLDRALDAFITVGRELGITQGQGTSIR